MPSTVYEPYYCDGHCLLVLEKLCIKSKHKYNFVEKNVIIKFLKVTKSKVRNLFISPYWFDSFNRSICSSSGPNLAIIYVIFKMRTFSIILIPPQELLAAFVTTGNNIKTVEPCIE